MNVAQNHGFRLPDLEDFKKMGFFDIPNSCEERVQLHDFIKNPIKNPLNTASGLIQIQSETIARMELSDCPPLPIWQEPSEWLGIAAPDQLHLISNQPDVRLHSQNDNGPRSRNSKTAGRETCVLHEKTAKKYDLKTGDFILITNERGACFAGVNISTALRQDIIVLSTGAWLNMQVINGVPTCIHGNPNILTLDKGSSGLSQGNIANTTLVRIQKWIQPLPTITVHLQPNLIER